MIKRPDWMSDSYWEELVKFHGNYFGPAAKDRYGTSLPNYKSLINRPVDIIQELVDNPPDAEATHIAVIIYPKVVMVIDNGHGMVPFFTEEGLAWANERIVAIGENTLGINDDLRAVVTDVSQRSLLWASSLAGMSGKAGREHSTGYRGVGIQAASQIGEPIEFITRPRPDLASEFYAPDHRKDPPVYRWVMPTWEQILKRQIDPVIEHYSGQFVDQNGRPMEYGTIVKINNLMPDALDLLRPENIVRAFQSRYGSKIRAGLTIEIIDRYSPAGVKTPGGIVIEVPPSEYKGYLIVDRSGTNGNMGLFMRSGGKSVHFAAEIYWNPDRKDPDKIMLRRNGIDFAELASVVKDPPWNIAGLNGYIEIPDETLDDTGMTNKEAIAKRVNARYAQASTDKRTIAEGPHFKAWRQVVRDMEELIPDAIKKRQDEINRKAGDEITKQMEEIIRDALGKYDDIRRIMSLPPVKDSQGNLITTKATNPRGPQVPIPIGVLHVQVLNEHNKGMIGVPLTIFRSKQRISMVTTTNPAGIALEVGSGTYEVQITLEPGWQLEEIKNPFPVFLKKDEGKKLIFHVKTYSEVRPKTPRLPGIHIYSSPFGVDKADRMYDDEHFKAAGTVRYNSDHPVIKEAQEPGKENRWRSLIAKMVTDAIERNFLEPHYGENLARQMSSELFYRFTEEAVAQKRTPKKRTAA